MKSVTQKHGQMARQMGIPPWADEIQIQEEGSWIVVTGDRGIFDPLPNEDQLEWDRDLLLGFDAGRRRTREDSRMAPHLLFAGAKTAQRQKDFIANFGPIDA